MKKARKVHFVLADPKVNYGCTCGCVLMKTVRNYDEQDVLACTPQLSDETKVTMWAPNVTCKACRKAMLDAGLVSVMSHSFMRDVATNQQRQKQSVQSHQHRSQP